MAIDLTEFAPPLAPSTPSAQPPEQDRMARAMQRLINEYKWSPEIAAGIVGNLWHESGDGESHVFGDSGQSYGLAQWNGPRRQALAEYATKKGKPMDDFDVQIDFVNHELATSYPHVIDKLWQAKSPVAAAIVFSNEYERPGTPMMPSRIAATRQAYQKIASSGPELALEDCTGSSCGDALANYMNSGPLKGTGVSLPKGGIGPGELASAGKAIGSPVYGRNSLSPDILTPGTVIHMTRRPGDRNYTAGATHIGIVDVDDAGEKVFKSFTPGKGWKYDRVDEQFIAQLPGRVTATNLINPDYEARASKIAYATDNVDLSAFAPPSTQSKQDGVDLSAFAPPSPQGADISKPAASSWLGDAYNYIKDVLSPGVDKDLEKAKVDFLKKNPDADEASINAAHAKLEEISAAHQMPLREAFSKNIRDFASSVITPVQGIAKAARKVFEPLETADRDVLRDLGRDRRVGPGRYGTEAEGEEPRGIVEQVLRPEGEKHYSGEGLVRAPGRVLGTLIPYAAAGKVAQGMGMVLTPASTFYEKLLFNLATFMPVDVLTGYQEADKDGIDKALWHSPITAALFTIGGLPSGKVTGTVGVGLAGAGSAAAGGERDPEKLAEAFATMAILHNIMKTKPERATVEVKDFIKENNITDAEVQALQDKLEGFRKQYAADRATPEQRVPEPTPEEVQAGTEKLKQEYVAGEEAALVTPADLPPEVVNALRKGDPLSSTQDMILQDKIKAALIGQRTAPESVAWEQYGFSPGAPGLQTPRTMASGAEPNVPGPAEPVPGLTPLSDRANEAAKVEGQAIAEQQAFKENFKRTYDWYEQIKVERGVDAADEALRNYREELRKNYAGTPVSTAADAAAAEQAQLAAKEGKRQTGIEDEGVIPMYSGGPDTSELMRKLAPVWYSRAQRFIGKKLPNVGTGQGLANTIQNWISKGVMPEGDGVKWTGVVPWLQERKGKVTRQEVVDFLEQNKVELRVVEKGGDKTEQADKNIAAQNTYGRDYSDLTVTERADLDAELMADSLSGYEAPSATKFQSYMNLPSGATNYREFYGVWPSEEVTFDKAHSTGDPTADVNRIFHAFTFDQVINGKKYLTIAELQSDWAHEGRTKGYSDGKSEYFVIAPDGRWIIVYETKDAANAELKRYGGNDKGYFVHEEKTPGVPPFPFQGNWMKVAMKKMLRQASEEGYDGLAWVSGDMVKERYNLSKVYDNVSSEKTPEGYKVTAKRLDTGDKVDVGVFKDAKAIKDAGIAEDMAEKLVKAEVKELKLPKDSELVQYENEWYVREDGSLLNWTRSQTKERALEYYFNTSDAVKPGVVRLVGVDLKLGGEWANKQYDSINPTTGEKVFGMPVFMDKYGKQWGARTKKTNIGTEITELPDNVLVESFVTKDVRPEADLHGDIADQFPSGLDKGWGVWENAGRGMLIGLGRTKAEATNRALEFLRKQDGGVGEVYTLDITPSMKETVLTKGQYMFSGGPDTSEWFKSLLRTGNAPKVLKGMTPAQLEVASRISVGDHEKKTWTTPTDVYTAIVDEVHPFKKYMEQYSKESPRITDDPYKQGILFPGWPGKAEAFIKYHPWDRNTFQFKHNVKGLADIYKPIEAAGNIEQFRTFLVARRSVERARRGLETGVDLEAALKTVEELGDKFGESVAQYDLYTDSILQFAVDSGLISPEHYIQIKKDSNDYAPLLRVMDLEPKTAGGKGFQASQVIKRFVGSEREIIDPLESTVRLTYALVNAAERNNVAASLIRWSKKSGAFGDTIYEINAAAIPIDIQLREVIRNKAVRENLEKSGLTESDMVIFRPSAFQPSPSTISVWENGVRKFYRVPKEIADVVKGMNETSADVLTRLLSVPAQALRLGATTLYPEFWGKNPLKDQGTAFIHSKYGYVPFVDLYRGIAEMARGGEQYWKYMISGAPHGELVSMDRRLLQNKLRDVLSGKLSMPGFLVYHPIEAAKLLSEYSERGTRIGEFKKGMTLQDDLKGLESNELTQAKFLAKHPVEGLKLLAEGAGLGKFIKSTPIEEGHPEAVQEAGYQSKDFTVNFSRKGGAATAKFINMVTAFWNPGVQGVDKFIRTHKERPLSTMAKAIAAVTIPSMLLEAVFGDDPRYQDLPAWRKDLFFNIPSSYGVVSLPKPWTYGLLYGAIPQRIMRSILEKDPHAYDGLLEAIGKEVPDFPLPTAITPIIEIWANKKLFTGTPLMPGWKKDLPAKFQFSGDTPETIKAVGNMVSNIPIVGESWMASPIALNHLLVSWTGGTGRMFTDATDYSLRKSGVLTVVPPPTARLSDTPVVRAFFARYPSLDAEPLQRFRERTVKSAAKMRFLTSQVMDMAMEGKQHKLLPLINELGPDTAMNLGSMTDAFNEMSKFAHLIERSKDMSPDQKRETVDRIYLAMIAAAKHTNRIVDQVLEQSKGKIVQPAVPKPNTGKSIFNQ
jgi:hypothetical protein